MSEERLDTETMSASSLNKRIKEISIDRLSELPDSLLIHILSFLEMKEAAITSVLSKRWQFLWTELPRLLFLFRDSRRETEEIRKFVARVHRTLVICSRNNLERFEVDFEYKECFACDVNVWVEFAVKNKVKKVSLLLNSMVDLHTLPQMMYYSNSSLMRLWVRGCIMAPRRTIEWQSLTELHLEEVELPHHALEKIMSGCPVLSYLHLRECWGFNCLEVNSPSLYKLEVHDCECEDGDDEPLLEISAPYIHSLDIRPYAKGRKMRVTNIPSLVISRIDFNGSDWDPSCEELMSTTKELFQNIPHVKELELGCECIMGLSVLVEDGWQLPQSRRRSLKLNAYRDDFSIYGIVGLLESSPDLETLVLEGYDLDGCTAYVFPAPRGDLDCDLLHLKAVNITNLALTDLADEPLLILAQILLKRAVALEKMVIEFEDNTPSSTLASGDHFKMAQMLLSYPRSSQKAVVLFR